MDVETKQKSKKIFKILSYVLVFFLFVCSLLCVIARFNGATFSLFGNRYDVVLTDSMSYKNEEFADFLKDDNNQYKAFDLVISRKLPSPEELNVHDVVIYTDRDIGTNMHRIVDKDTKYYERVSFTASSQKTIGEYSGVSLDEVGSQILTNDIKFKTMSITTFSTLESTDNFHFYFLNKFYFPEVTRTPVNGGYLTTYNFSKTSEAPGGLKISHKGVYNYQQEIVTGVHIDSKEGVIDVKMNDLVPSNEDSQTLTASYNKQFIYKTRGDASKLDDGWYSYNEIQAIVVNNMPGMGYPIRFMGSIWGGFMFVLLAILILVVDIISDRMDKKALEAAASAENGPVVEEVPEEKVEEQPSVEEEPKPEEPKEEQPVEESKTKGRFIPKGGKQKKINWPPKNTRWTKENNPTANKRRAEGGQKK